MRVRPPRIGPSSLRSALTVGLTVGPTSAVVAAIGARPALANNAAQLLGSGGNSPRNIRVDGWAGFYDIGLLLNFMSSLTLAAILALIVSWSPRNLRYLQRMSGAATPMVMVMYGVIGAVIGTIVVHYGMGVGLVVFGIGGLMRFRSNMGNPESTGRVILATVIGLCSGLQLPHVAVTGTLFVFGLLILSSRTASFRLLIKGLPPEILAESALAHREVLDKSGCLVVGEKKNFLKGQVTFLFRAPSHMDPDLLVRGLEQGVDEPLRGAIDWDIG